MVIEPPPPAAVPTCSETEHRDFGRQRDSEPMPIRPLLHALAAGLLALASTPAAAEAIALPEIGASGAALVSPIEERRTGEAVVRNIRRAGGILDDPLVTDYLNFLGYRLVSHSDTAQRQFTFFVVNDDAINAFALPGGYIGVNYGLLLATESENELASVMAHEIAHVTQRHHARAYELSENSNNIPVLAAIIAAIVLGSQGSELGQAALTSLAAGNIQRQLDFTRANEKEADYIGIALLADSGFNPASMADFFHKLEKESRLYGSSAPEFLRTHPVTENRIADALNRAAQYPHRKWHSSRKYYLMRSRLAVLTSRDPESTYRQFENDLRNGRYIDKAAARYGLALAMIATKRYDAARTVLDRLLDEDDGRIAYLLARAELETLAGNHPAALTRFADALADYPGNGPLTLAYARALLKAGKPQATRDLIHAWRKQGADDSSIPEIWQLLATAEAKLGHRAESHVALGEYFYRIGQTHQAIRQLKQALKGKEPLDFYHTARIEARIDAFQQELAMLQSLHD